MLIKTLNQFNKDQQRETRQEEEQEELQVLETQMLETGKVDATMVYRLRELRRKYAKQDEMEELAGMF